MAHSVCIIIQEFLLVNLGELDNAWGLEIGLMSTYAIYNEFTLVCFTCIRALVISCLVSLQAIRGRESMDPWPIQALVVFINRRCPN